MDFHTLGQFSAISTHFMELWPLYIRDYRRQICIELCFYETDAHENIDRGIGLGRSLIAEFLNQLFALFDLLDLATGVGLRHVI